MTMRIGVDTGGTFTDFVIEDAGRLRIHKVLSTPAAPERAILEGLDALLGGTGAHFAMVHGSTVATNAVLEGKGARTALVTNHGFADLLTIGRQNRRALYDLQPVLVPPPVEPELCLETGGRVAPDGSVLEPLDADGARRAGERVRELGVDSVAICLLFSFVDDRFERMLADAMPETLFVSRSSAVLAEYREYERGIATWLNAFVGPVMAGYIDRLQEGIGQAPLAVMQSSGGTVSSRLAAERGVHLLLSGPAGGLSGARFIGRNAGHARLMTLDMGGTSTDVSLVDGAPRLTTEGHIGHYPVAVPMVDLHTIGAGGGSIARVDDGGMLKVGPQSAGANPGPACYGNGGKEPTVTDANAVLGRLPAGTRLGGSLELDLDAARAAVGRISRPLGMGIEDAAGGIIRIANEHMAQALRVISVERGEDPREFVLFPFGGAAGLHVCALAGALGMRRVLSPANAGVLSALGMLAAPRARETSRTWRCLVDGVDSAAIDSALESLAGDTMRSLAEEGIEVQGCADSRRLDMRYSGQSFTLEIPWHGDSARAIDDFHAAHERRYGHRLDQPVEMVNLRVRVESPAPEIEMPHRETGAAASPLSRHRLHGIGQAVPVYDWDALPQGQELDGPALVAARDSTLWIAPEWSGQVDAWGNIALERGA